VLASIRKSCPWLRHVFADGGYAGPKLRGALDKIGDWTVEIVKRSDTAVGFKAIKAPVPFGGSRGPAENCLFAFTR